VRGVGRLRRLTELACGGESFGVRVELLRSLRVEGMRRQLGARDAPALAQALHQAVDLLRELPDPTFAEAAALGHFHALRRCGFVLDAVRGARRKQHGLKHAFLLYERTVELGVRLGKNPRSANREVQELPTMAALRRTYRDWRRELFGSALLAGEPFRPRSVAELWGAEGDVPG
jgi:hypothetical protein